MASLLLQSRLLWLLLVVSLDRTFAEYGEVVFEEGTCSTLSKNTRFDADVVFFKPEFYQGIE